MLSSSPLKPAAPSASLLRFLRSQSDALCFFTANPKACTRASGESWSQHKDSGNVSLGRTSRWTDMDSVPCQASLEAALLPMLNPLSKSANASQSQPSPSVRRPTALYPLSSSQFSRNVSTKSRPLLRRLLDLKRAKTTDGQKLNRTGMPQVTTALDDGAEGNLFNLGRTLAAKASNEMRLRCTEFDGSGNVTLVNGEFKKSELIAKYGLLPRDLRKIDSSVLPHILVRPGTILISLLHLRVLIKADRVLVFDAYGSTDSYTQSVFMYDLEGKLRQKQAQTAGALPYEFRALEAVLISVTSGLEGEFEGVREPVVRVLRALEEDIDRDKLRHLLIYSKKLGTFEQKARLVRDAIDDLLEADDDLAAMYLTERANGKERDENDHQEVEMLLESYHKVCDEIVQASGNLVTGIRNTEEVVKAILDANRNSLMLLDLKFSIGTLGLASGTLVSALYGMNLKNFIEESDLGFGAVSVACFISSAVVCLYGLAKLRKVQRVRMWGEAGVGGTAAIPPLIGNTAMGNRANWRTDTIEPMLGGFPGEGRVERMKRLKEGAAAAAAARSASRPSSESHPGGPLFVKQGISRKDTDSPAHETADR
ncbi:inner membrane magnesium transporter mrs2 [Paecilomyces variotii No. 5]|uniref:Magnesium transporter n=1 Tax=Byssochlamys spectabilis (strain No. 5 / NBRC 109023) TaxID=1356009 RepID=V5FMR7_BYSSN|nr:inner membrane magnesium transporter mrs2 [Paecilomyces variotii No. 5]